MGKNVDVFTRYTYPSMVVFGKGVGVGVSEISIFHSCTGTPTQKLFYSSLFSNLDREFRESVSKAASTKLYLATDADVGVKRKDSTLKVALNHSSTHQHRKSDPHFFLR